MSLTVICPQCSYRTEIEPQPGDEYGTCAACGRVILIEKALVEGMFTTPRPGDETSFVPPLDEETKLLPPPAAASFEPAPPAAVEEAPAGEEVFGPYALIQQISANDISVLYRARDIRTGSIVALKVLMASNVGSHVDLDKLKRRARSAMTLSHPNIARVLEVDDFEGMTYIAREFVNGRPLTDCLAEESLSLNEGIMIVHAVANALRYAHTEDVWHRNLKPNNIIIDNLGNGIVTDFGLGRDPLHTLGGGRRILAGEGGEMFGMPYYISPDRVEGNAASALCDVYSLGAILYHHLTGKPPFVRDHLLKLLPRIMRGEPEAPRKIKPSVPEGIEQIALAALERYPQLRYPSMRHMMEDLDRFMNGQAPLGRPASSLARFLQSTRRYRVAVGLAVLALLELGSWHLVSLNRRNVEKQQAAAEHFMAAAEAQDRDDLQTAFREFEQGERIGGWPKEKDIVHYRYGMVLAERQDWKKAEEQFDRAILAKRRDPGVYLRRGLTRYHQRKYEDAAGDFEEAAAILAKEPANSKWNIEHCYYYLGMARWGSGEFELAREKMELAAEAKPDQTVYREMLKQIQLDAAGLASKPPVKTRKTKQPAVIPKRDKPGPKKLSSGEWLFVPEHDRDPGMILVVPKREE